ncbi:hypothetical protein [Qipengyuania sp. MTN3-11]|uniref:hypothetical protein n=1 Tax=Qipengyuania sp. MTN3-11 TaxID=3056557 RepID=UPI0036F43C52
MRKLLTMTAVAAAAFAIAGTPAMAQDSEAGPGSQDTSAEDNQIDDGSSNTQNEDSLQNSLNGLRALNGWSNFNNDNAADQDNDENGSYNSNTFVVAEQELKAVNINRELDEVVDLDGIDETESSVGYNSGNNSVNDNAFAAFAGISNAAWNTGINANTQAATNIAAQGTINFGVSSGSSAAGEGTGGED